MQDFDPLIEDIKRKSAEAIGLIPVDTVSQAAKMIVSAYQDRHTWFLAGNGGSAADAQHIAAEMVGRFVSDRAALPAIALGCNGSSLTAISNDYGYDASFSRQLEALAKPGDVFLGISTSGNSENVIRAIETAKQNGILTIGLTGRDGGKMAKMVDCHIGIPVSETARIQEAHITVGHILCTCIERELFGFHQ